MKSKLNLLLILIFIISCKHANYEKLELNQTIKSKLDEVSFNQVDVFPSFETCKVQEDAALTKSCFINTLHQSIQKFLQENEFENDSLNLAIEINKSGKLFISEIKSNNLNSTRELESNLNLFLEQNLPKLFPAQKQGVPIHCKIDLPVIITNEI